MSKRELRIALQEKLEHRRKLIKQNKRLRFDLEKEERRNEHTLRVLCNPVVNRELDYCADEIMKAVIDHAVKASTVVFNETMDSGDYYVGLSIPSLHIRRRLRRLDLSPIYAGEELMTDRLMTIKRVEYDGTKK